MGSKEHCCSQVVSDTRIRRRLTGIQLLQALEGNFESKRVAEGGRVVEDHDVSHVHEGHRYTTSAGLRVTESRVGR